MKYDASYQKLFSNPEMVEDLIKNFVTEEWVKDLDFSTLEKISSKFFSDELTRREGDLIFKVKTFQGKPAYLMLLLEFQSTPDEWMAVRFLVYTGLLYQNLVKDKTIVDKKLPPVFPLVLYNGKPDWTAQTDMKKLIDLPRSSKLWPFQPQIRYYVIDENQHLNAANTLSSILFKMEKDPNIEHLTHHLTQLIDLLNHPGYELITQDFLSWLRHVVEEKHQMEFDFGQIESISEARDMLKENIEAWKQNLIVTGMTQGLTQGREEGMTLGREEGILIGEALLLERQLKRRFGALADDITQKLRYATQEELENWSYAVLDAKTLEDVFQEL